MCVYVVVIVEACVDVLPRVPWIFLALRAHGRCCIVNQNMTKVEPLLLCTLLHVICTHHQRQCQPLLVRRFLKKFARRLAFSFFDTGPSFRTNSKCRVVA